MSATIGIKPETGLELSDPESYNAAVHFRTVPYKRPLLYTQGTKSRSQINLGLENDSYNIGEVDELDWTTERTALVNKGILYVDCDNIVQLDDKKLEEYLVGLFHRDAEIILDGFRNGDRFFYQNTDIIKDRIKNREEAVNLLAQIPFEELTYVPDSKGEYKVVPFVKKPRLLKRLWKTITNNSTLRTITKPVPYVLTAVALGSSLAGFSGKVAASSNGVEYMAPGEAGWNEPNNREDKVKLNDTVFREWEAYNERPDPIDFEFNVTSRELGWEAEPLHEEFTLNYGETRIVNYTTWGPSEGDDGEEERAVIQLRTEGLYKSTDARTTLVVPPENNTEEPANDTSNNTSSKDKSIFYVSSGLASLTVGISAAVLKRRRDAE